MSNETYDLELDGIEKNLVEVLQIEPVQADIREQRQLLALLYVKYIIISNQLSECIDQMIQPQKRKLMRKLLEATLGRILELKYDLVEADLNEWTHVGDVLGMINKTPFDIELKIPACFREDRQDEINHNNNVIKYVMEKLGYLDSHEKQPQLTMHQAVLIIQTHERARQSRIRTQYMKEIRTQKEKLKPISITEEQEQQRKSISLSAALRIQKIWRGYVTRRMTRRKKTQEMYLIGMIPPPKVDKEEFLKDSSNKLHRKKLQKLRQEQYEAAIVECQNRLQKYQRPIMLEQLSDQVRGWLYEYKEQTGKIPDYTSSERTQSRLLMSRQGTDSETSKSTPVSSKDSKSKKDKGKSKDAKKNEDDETETTKASVSLHVPELNTCKEEYEEVWKIRNLANNIDQKHYNDLIENEEMAKMEVELRKIVDEMMKNELIILQALDRDKGQKAKKKASKKVRKSSKKSKRKKEKDLTPDRTTESLFEELVANGIIKQYPEVYLNDFKGEKSFFHPAPHNRGDDPPIALGDIRQLITEYCIIPMLTPQLHENTQHIKSLMIAGASGSGKDMLIHAICTELGAVLFDLSPANIVGKYPGKTGLIMLIHLVTKVSRLFQPAIIYMDKAERPFVKKIPKTDKTDPKRLKKDLPKMINNFSPEDRVMFIGVSSCPWESDQKLLQQVYRKYLIIPKPEYGSRYIVWTHLLEKYSIVNWQFDVSGMSRVSDGYTIGSMISSIGEVMTTKRVLQLKVHPLNPRELIDALSKRCPIYKEEEEAMDSWWFKTPICRRRAKAVEILFLEEEEVKAKQANQKRGKPKES